MHITDQITRYHKVKRGEKKAPKGRTLASLGQEIIETAKALGVPADVQAAYEAAYGAG